MQFPGTIRFDPDLGELWLPYIDVVLRNGNYEAETRMLVDSGAHITVIPNHLGLALGLQPEQENLRIGQVVGGGSVLNLMRRIEVVVGGHDSIDGWYCEHGGRSAVSPKLLAATQFLTIASLQTPDSNRPIPCG